MAGNSGTAGLIIFIMGILGLIMAAIEQIAYDSGYWLTKYVSDPGQLPGLQILTIVVFMLIGCILAAIIARS